MSEQNQGNQLKHIGVIMDGNRRWARKNGLKSILNGHEQGVKKLMDVCEWCENIQVPYLSVYAFSTENWRRATWEVEGLFRILEKFLKDELQNTINHGIRIKVVGDRSMLNDHQRSVIEYAEEKSAHCDTLIVQIAISYGGKDELTRAVRNISSDVASGKIDSSEISESLIEGYLDTAGIPMIDMVIRTGGNHRLSNFFTWQTSYSELYFCDTLWPDFSEEEFLAFVADYRQTAINMGK